MAERDYLQRVYVPNIAPPTGPTGPGQESDFKDAPPRTLLAGFLRTRFDELELVARKAGATGAQLSAPVASFETRGVEIIPDLTIDPDFLLAYCKASRRLVELHDVYSDQREFWHKGKWEYGDTYCQTCGDPEAWDQTPPVPWPCPTILAVALPFTGHPECLDEWRL